MTENKYKNKQEQGRSMVEMLGVLAVVGVLSVGSIAGYTYAMNKYYANELLAGASERAVLVAAQIASGRTPNLNEFANHTVPNGTFGDVEEFEDGGFGIKVSSVKDAVCQNVLKALDGTEVFIAKDDNAEVLNEMSESDCSGDDNSFLFVYADDMGAIDSIFDPETPTDEEKKEYFCSDAGVYKGSSDNHKFITSCSPCSNMGTYDSDEEAIAAMCDPVLGSPGAYYCSGNVVVGPDFSSYCSGACEGTGYFENGNEAIAALCDTTLEEYTCSGNYIVKNGMPVSGCAVCTNAGTYYSDEEAIRAMCTGSYACSSEACVTDGLYYCDENNLLGQKGNGSFYSWCGCNAGTAKFQGVNFDNKYEAIIAMCYNAGTSIGSFYCSANEIRDYENGVAVSACACLNGKNSYGTVEDAIDYLCSGYGFYHCSDGTSSLYKESIFVTNCTCSSYGEFMSDEEAIAALCE